MIEMNEWAARGACRSADPDALFVQGAAQNRAKSICMPTGVPVPCHVCAQHVTGRSPHHVHP